MEVFHQMKLFQKVASAIFITFMGIMVIVTIYAFSRQSGFTRQDMAEAPLIRAKAVETLVAERDSEKL